MTVFHGLPGGGMAQTLKRCCWLAMLLGSVSTASGQQPGVEAADSAVAPNSGDSSPVGIVRLRQWQHEVVRTAAQDPVTPIAASPAPGVVQLPIISPRARAETAPARVGVVRLSHAISAELAPAPFPEVFLPPTPIPTMAEIVVADVPANVVVFPKGDTEWQAVQTLPSVTTIADLTDEQLLPPLQATSELWAQVEPRLAAPVIEAPPLPAAPESAPIANGDEQRRLARLQHLQRPLGAITVSEVDPLAGPTDQAAQLMANESPLWIPSGGWANPPVNRYPVCFQYQPLYFEEINLERCGWGHGVLQPICSSATFLGNTALLPVHMLADHPKDCVPTPGDCPACHRWTMEQLLWKLDEE